MKFLLGTAAALFLRRLLVLIGLWLAISLSLIVGIRRNAITQAEIPPEVAVLLPDSTCKPPCWQGIRPGVMGIKEVNTALAGDSDWIKDLGEHWRYHGDPAHYLTPGAENLTFEVAGVTLGEWLAVMGEPDFQTLTFVIIGRSYEQVRQVSIYYLDEQLEVMIQLPSGQRLTPYTPLTQLYYTAFAAPFYTEAWQGFIWLPSSPEFSSPAP